MAAAALCDRVLDAGDFVTGIGAGRIDGMALDAVQKGLAALHAGQMGAGFSADALFALLAAHFARPPRPVTGMIRARAGHRAFVQALDLIHAHADDLLTTEGLAQVVGTSTRSLQRLFQAKLGLSPMAYLDLYRMHMIRADLLARDSAGRGRVSRAALRWGMTEFGRFAVRYRLHFGESPSSTRAPVQVRVGWPGPGQKNPVWRYLHGLGPDSERRCACSAPCRKEKFEGHQTPKTGVSAMALCLGVAAANADVIADVTVVGQQVGNDVVLTFSGSVDTTNLSVVGATTYAAGAGFYCCDPVGLWAVDGSTLARYSAANSSVSDLNFSPTNYSFSPGTLTGGQFVFLAAPNGGTGYVYLPNTYASGTQINTVITFANTTLAALNADQDVTLTVGDQTLVYDAQLTPVPVPAALPLMLAGLGALGMAARRRR